MLQEVINSAHACSISSRYLKCLIPKKETEGILRVLEQIQ